MIVESTELALPYENGNDRFMVVSDKAEGYRIYSITDVNTPA